MKAGITVDDVRTTKYVLGEYNFYTRTVSMDDSLAERIQKAEAMHTVSQRILSSLYNSNGRFVNPDDIKEFECLFPAPVVEATPEAESEKQPKKRASAVRSSNESQKE